MSRRLAPNEATDPAPAAEAAARAKGAAAAPAATTPATADWPRDEYTGIGGDYIRDPITGLRTPAPKVPAPVPPAAQAAGDTAAA